MMMVMMMMMCWAITTTLLWNTNEYFDVKNDALCLRVVLRPLADKLVEMMWTEDRPVARQVVEVVHDDGHEQVDDLHTASINHTDRVLKVSNQTDLISVRDGRLFSNRVIDTWNSLFDTLFHCLLSPVSSIRFLAECYYVTFGLWHEPSVCPSVCLSVCLPVCHL